MKAVETIGEVINRQQTSIKFACINQSTIDYFAVLYQKMTRGYWENVGFGVQRLKI